MMAVGDKKQCSTCRRILSVDGFYKNRATKDGLNNQCMPCARDTVRQYNKTPQGRAGVVAKDKRAGIRYPEKKRARIKLRQAVYAGKLVRPSQCGNCNIACLPDGHHIDYSQPLNVLWLCDICHKVVHGRLRDRSLLTLSNLEGDSGSSHIQGTPKAQGHEADNLSAESAGE